ncbi:MAG TPA: alpha/beta hydrolase [Vicinamibacterales bacterium]|nr:alpha/beta hydrolase [Vicinamibacterales bacterium]
MPEGRYVDVGGGASLEAVVEGNGPLTVVFENGLATPLEEWDAVVPRIAARARVVRYNHRQAPPRGPLPAITVDSVMSDLDALLRTIDARPPYVFVGHSWGGVLVRLFAHAHPADVAGLVFIDATHEALDERTLAILPAMYSVMLALGQLGFLRRRLFRQLCPPGASEAYRTQFEERLRDPVRWPVGLRTARAETPAIALALARLRRDCPELPPVPVEVLTAGKMTSRSALRVYEGWKETVSRAARAEYRSVPAAGHYMAIDAPGDVAAAIIRVLDQITPPNH